jgi:hypothetical protein
VCEVCLKFLGGDILQRPKVSGHTALATTAFEDNTARDDSEHDLVHQVENPTMLADPRERAANREEPEA